MPAQLLRGEVSEGAVEAPSDEIKGALLFRKGIIVTSVPYHLER